MRTTPVEMLRFSQLRTEGAGFKNPRKETGLEKDKLELLAADIKERGIQEPLMVWACDLKENDEATYVILDGQRRYLALTLLKEQGVRLPPIPCTVREGALVEVRLDVLAKYLQREGWSQYELAEEIVSLKAASPNLNGKEIAKRLHVSPALVSRVTTIYEQSSPELKAAWRTQALAADTIYDIARTVPPAKQARTLASLAPRGADTMSRKTRSELRKRVTREVRGENPRPPAKDGQALIMILTDAPSDDDYLMGVRDGVRYMLGDFWDSKKERHDLDKFRRRWSEFYRAYLKLHKEDRTT